MNKYSMNNMRKKYKLYITVFIAGLFTITTLISVGFGALNKDLTISGDIDYEEAGNYLYSVLKREANIGTYAKEYTGDHRDSFTETPTKNVYYWYGSNDTNATTILDKWNVLFGGFCWQMFRTTDTGGVKLIYNGTPTDGTCNNIGGVQQIGTSYYNDYPSLAYTGYMFNTRHYHKSMSPTRIDVLTRTGMTNSSNYYYGTGVTYSNGTYTLTGTTQAKWSNTYSSAGGLYTCASTSSTTCSTVYYITVGASGAMYGFEMTDGNLLNYYNSDLTLGTSYTKSNGIFTLSNYTTITRLNWYSNYSTYKKYYTCGDDNVSCTKLQYITSTGNNYYYALTDNYIYANDFTYDSGTDTYTLSSNRYEAWELTDTDKTNLATHHYTCFNETGTCQTLSYVAYVGAPQIYYMELTVGKSIGDILDEMLYNDNVNTYNSTLKRNIDNWYQSNMTSYTSYLEDTIFCNNRAQSNASINGWNPDGGSVTKQIILNYDSLSCTNDTDKFSVSNNKAKLTYPVGPASYKEMDLLNNNNLKKTSNGFWYSTPYSFNFQLGSASAGYARSTGAYGFTDVNSSFGVRPVVSLKPGTEYASGTGSKDDPYIVE